MEKGLLQGCDPHRISSNIETLKSRGVPEVRAIGMAHAHAKRAKKAQADAAAVVAPTLQLGERVE